jgi:hypothetical protein
MQGIGGGEASRPHHAGRTRASRTRGGAFLCRSRSYISPCLWTPRSVRSDGRVRRGTASVRCGDRWATDAHRDRVYSRLAALR